MTVVKFTKSILSLTTAAALSVCLLCSQSHALDEQPDKSFLSAYTRTYFDDSVSDYISSEITCIYQCSDGYIWFGSYNGLIRYDGDNYRMFNSSTNKDFTGDAIRDIYEDNLGRIWIGTNDGGALCMDDSGAVVSFTKENESEHSLRSDSVRFITGDSRNNIYIFTTSGVLAVNAELEQIALPDAFSALVCTSVDCDGRYLYCVGANDGKLYTYDTDTSLLEDFSDRSEFSSVVCKAVSVIESGRIAIGTDSNKLFTLTMGTSHSRAYITSYSTGNRSVASCIYTDSQENIFVYTGSGLCYFDSSMILHNVDGFPDDFRLQDIIQDYEGNYWFATTNSGALCLTKNLFVDYNYKENLSIEAEVNATITYHGVRYIGTDKGLIAVNDTDNELAALLSSTRIRCLYKDSSDRLWAGGFVLSYDEGAVIAPLVCYDGTEMKIYSTADGLRSDEVRCVYELHNGTIAVGTNENGVQFIKDGKILSDSEVEAQNKAYANIPVTKILSIYQCRSGRLYAGLDGNGLFTADPSGSSILLKNDGLSGEVILRMTGDSKTDGVWVSTGTGVDFIDESGKITNIKKLAETGMTSVFDIVFTDSDKMLLLTENCIYICSRENLLSENPLSYTTMSKSDGLNGTINANAWNELIDEKLYICCFKGVTCIDVNHTQRDKKEPNITINNIEVDNNSYEHLEKQLVLSADTTRLTIDLALLSFVPEPSYSIEYKLSGQDGSTVTLSVDELRNNNITYTNLRGGEYEFFARVINSDGSTGDTVQISIVKEKSFFENIIVWIILSAGVLAFVIIVTIQIMRSRQKALVRKQEEYKKITIEAITAIANTIDAKDEYTRGHSVRVAAFSVEIARRMKLSKAVVENIFYMALLHDIGKIAIPDEILNKTSRLTAEEYEIMKQHPRIGYEILKSITTVKNIGWGARYHHERYDGKGYNTGLAGTDIPIEARIICAADAFDAMSSKRAYRDGLPKTYIISEFRKCKGTQFDPQVADVVLNMLEQSYFDNTDEEDFANIAPEHADVHIETGGSSAESEKK